MSRQMEFEVQIQEMLKGLACDLPDSALTNAGKGSIEEFTKECCTNTCRAIYNLKAHVRGVYEVIMKFLWIIGDCRTYIRERGILLLPILLSLQ